MRPPIRLILVEDDRAWRRALKEMYEDLLVRHDIEWAFATDTDEAVSILESSRHQFDLLSLDFLLEGTDGRVVLRAAHELSACKAVIVITGFDQMIEFEAVVPDERDRRVARMTMQPFIQRLFPKKHLYLKKELSEPIEENIEIFRQELKEGRILELIGPDRVIAKEGETWRIVFAGQTVWLSDRLGLAYLSKLLTHPYTRFTCRELEDHVKGVDMNSGIEEVSVQEELAVGALRAVRTPNGAQSPSPTRMRNLERELKEIRDDLASAEVMSSDLEDALRVRKEILEDELAGLRLSSNKNVNDRVTASLRRVVTVLRAQHTRLAEHLELHLKIGSDCWYVPPDRVVWNTEDPTKQGAINGR